MPRFDRRVIFVAVAATVAGTVATPGCGGDDVYQGQAGTPVGADFDGLVPSVQLTVNGGPPHDFICDSGSPITILDTSVFPTEAEGKHNDDLAAFGLTFPQYPDVAFALFGDSSQSAGGIVGGDLLRHFGYTLDYQGNRVWLSDPFDPAALPTGVSVENETLLPLQLRGGGRGSFPGCTACGTFEFPATRIVIKLTLEGQTAPVWAVLDTGASAVVLDEALFAELGDSPPRPRLPLQLGTPTGLQDAFLSRVWRARAGGASGDASVSLDDMPVLVVPGSTIFGSISGEVGLPVRALIGGAFLRWFLTTIDYQRSEVRLARYTDESHIDPDEFIGVGFDLRQSGQSWTVADVTPGSDADAQGLVVGDIVDQIGTVPITGQPASVVNMALGSYHEGERVPVGVRRAAGLVTLMILVENLLPDYPPP